jgi:hypothetical protein
MILRNTTERSTETLERSIPALVPPRLAWPVLGTASWSTSLGTRLASSTTRSKVIGTLSSVLFRSLSTATHSEFRISRMSRHLKDDKAELSARRVKGVRSMFHLSLTLGLPPARPPRAASLPPRPSIASSTLTSNAPPSPSSPTSTPSFLFLLIPRILSSIPFRS